MACLGQEIVTNYVYVYETKEITNRVWTVSNITERTQVEITNYVNRFYTYYITNQTSYVTNYYFTTNTTHYITNLLETVVLSQTNITYETEVHRHVHYNYVTNFNIYSWTNLTVNITTNVYTDVMYTNFAAYVDMFHDEVSNAINTVASQTNKIEQSIRNFQDTYSDVELYAYITTEAMRSLGSTNGIYITTNEFIYTDANGVSYNNMINLTMNNMNGGLKANVTGGSYYSTRYCIIISPTAGRGQFYFRLSHATSGNYGMKIFYLVEGPVPVSGTSNSSWYKWVPVCLYWEAGRLNLVMCSPSGELYSNQSSILSELASETPSHSCTWPNSISITSSDDATYGSGKQFISGHQYNRSYPYFKTAQTGNPTTSTISSLFVPRSPSLEDWKLMWKITKLSGYQFFR